MKTLIIKTVVITLIITIVASFLTFFLLGLFFPSAISNMAYKVNGKKIAIKYAEIDYNRNNEIYSLSQLVEKSIWADCDNYVIKYSPILLYHSDYNEFLKSKETNYQEYIVNSYVEALYDSNEFTKSVDVAYAFYNSSSTTNTFRVLIYLANSNNDKSTLLKISEKLRSVENKTEETVYLINLLNSIL